MLHESHFSDEELLLAADGQLAPARAAEVVAHLAQCWPCRTRRQELEQAIGDFVRLHRGNLDPLLPSAAGPRALLKAQLTKMASNPDLRWTQWPELFGWKSAAAALLVALVIAIGYFDRAPRPAPHTVPVSFPEPSLTPGAVATVNKAQVCGSVRPKNRMVPASLQRKVFEEYGIPRAEPRAYEVDYLITPALGGADDIRNLWPQSYSSAVWNARVKDALEDRLHELVCDGSVDLVAAQRDLSSDWIAAYKKYFHTDKPLKEDSQN
jgi:hypothetical protein